MKLLISQVDHRWRWDRDVLNEGDGKRLHQIKEKAEELTRTNFDIKKTESFITDSLKVLHQAPPKNTGMLKEWLELLVVVFGVVMGARALFLQPFKIPTGSMQPTLLGINFFNSTEASEVGFFRRIFDYVNYSKRFTDIVIQEEGYLKDPSEKGGISVSRKNPLFFFPYTKLQIGDQIYKLPGEPENVLKDIISLQKRPYKVNANGSSRFYFQKGDILARGYLQLGDHLFVDRVRFNFMEPKRGDITVFITDGIEDVFGHPLRGRFFIKRLVGLPGDELKIMDRKLYVREPGQEAFSIVDGSFHPGFDRMYTGKGGYKGYSHPGHVTCQYLRNNQETFTLKKDEYFMLGDNSESSQDSRFWGVVPRRNIVGRANFVYWPFSRRWGFADTVQPEDFDSYSTNE